MTYAGDSVSKLVRESSPAVAGVRASVVFLTATDAELQSQSVSTCRVDVNCVQKVARRPRGSFSNSARNAFLAASPSFIVLKINVHNIGEYISYCRLHAANFFRANTVSLFAADDDKCRKCISLNRARLSVTQFSGPNGRLVPF